MTDTTPSSQPTPAAETIAHDDLCPICHLLLYNPVRTQCNHVLCASCMAQWADVSSMTHVGPSNLDLDLNLNDFDPNYDPAADLATLEANCPMCRTPTTASLHEELRRTLETRYPATYAERRVEEEAARGAKIGEEGIEGMTILIGNRHKLLRDRGEGVGNKHDWTFFVRFSRPETIQEVRVNLHPTFRPPRLTLTEPPFEIRRLGWGYFNIEANILLKEPYYWVQSGTDTRRQALMLDWMLNFDGQGKQGRVRVKVKKMCGNDMELDDDEDDNDYEDMDDDDDEDDDDLDTSDIV